MLTHDSTFKPVKAVATTSTPSIVHHPEAESSSSVPGRIAVDPFFSSAVAGPSHQGFGFTQSTAYVPYPYVPYSFFPQRPMPSPTQATSRTVTPIISQSLTLPTAPPSAVAPPTPSTPSTSPIAPHQPPELNTLKRPYEGGATIIEPAQKRTRHCCKCGSQDCKGKGGRSFCTNKCQDCGKLDCKGRNSRRPDKKCTEAWQ